MAISFLVPLTAFVTSALNSFRQFLVRHRPIPFHVRAARTVALPRATLFVAMNCSGLFRELSIHLTFTKVEPLLDSFSVYMY